MGNSAVPLQIPVDPDRYQELIRENQMLRQEIRVSREAAEITAGLVVKQFEETERVLRRFQDANAMLDKYYEARGWDMYGRPKKETLERLGLE